MTHKGTFMANIVVIHSSNEMYGADRMLLEVLQSVPPERAADVVVWLPDDVEPTGSRLDARLDKEGWRHWVGGVPIMRRAYMKPNGLPGLVGRTLRAAVKLRKERPEVVYCTTSATLLMAPIARLLGVKRVLLHVQEFWSGPESRVLDTLARFCTDVVAISDPVKDALPANLQERTQVIINGTARPAALPSTPGGGGQLQFLMAGRWNVWKGHETLLRAWDTDEPMGHLTILGGPPPSGPCVDVRALVAALKNPSSVTVVGEVGDIAPHIASSDVMVVPSDKPEPFGLVAIEAFANGRPVVGSNAGGLSSIVEHDVTGRQFPVGDVPALRENLAGLTAVSVARMGSAAMADYEERFSSEVFRGKFATVWKNLLGADLSASQCEG
jgi:glycosyltransferase involved in cell wall biosynthesis